MGGISGIFNLLSIGGFLLFILGIALIVASVSQNRRWRGGAVLAVFGLVAGVVFSIISQGIIVVQPQEVAVVFQTVSGELLQPRGPGTHVIVPVVQSAEIYPTEFETYTQEEGGADGQGPIRARTIDGQEVLIEVSVIYRIDPTEVNTVRERWQRRYQSDLIIPVLRGDVREVVSQYRAEAVYGESRAVIAQQIEEAMRDRLDEEGIELSDLIIRDISFSNQEFEQSIENVQIAEQQRLEAQQAAERERIRAQGERDAAIARAEGESQSTILRAQGQAEALSLVSEQIAANPSLIQYEYIQNLSDQVGLILVPSNSPFLFDFNTLLEANPDFTAPSVPQSAAPTQAPPPATPAPTPVPGNN